MEIVSMKHDGTIVVELSAQEAQEVRDDLGAILHTKVSRSGDQLHSLLEWAQPSRQTAAEQQQEDEPARAADDLPPQLRAALDIMAKRGRVVELTAPWGDFTRDEKGDGR